MATQLTITPDFTKKTAQLVGSIAVGEKVSLLVVGVDSEEQADLRVRIRYDGNDVARFPHDEGDSWDAAGDNVSGTIDLNTVEFRTLFEGLDDFAKISCSLLVECNGDVSNLYAIAPIQIRNWAPIPGDQVPVEIGDWADDLEAVETDIQDTKEALVPLQDFLGHTHDGESGEIVDHDNLANTGVNSHSEIDTKLSSLNSAMNSYAGAVTAHTSSTNNPHGVTKAQVGLGNVNNTSDADKPLSDAAVAALALKIEADALAAHTVLINNPHSVTKTQVGLGSVDNTSDANKPLSTAASGALALKAAKSVVDAHIANQNDPHGSLAKLAEDLSGVEAPTTIGELFTVVIAVLAALKGEE